MCFIINNFTGAIDFPDFDLLFVKRKEKYNLRSTRPLVEEKGSILVNNYVSKAPINRLRKLWNDLSDEIRDELVGQANKNLLKSLVLKNF